MRKFFLAALSIICLGLGLAIGQQVPGLSPPTGIACAFNNTVQVIASGQAGWVQCNSDGSLLVTSSPSGLQQVVGNVASGAADSGNPVKVGGVYNTTLPTLDNGDRGDLQVGSRGSLNVTIFGTDSTTGPAVTNVNGDAIAGTQVALSARAFNTFYNGSTWDRTFTCANSSPIGVVGTAPGLTQLILPLSGSTIIRICSIIGTISPQGLISLSSGTGGTCGAATTTLATDIGLNGGTPFSLSAGQGSVVRSGAGHNLCMTVKGGTFSGVVTYSQY